MTARRQQSGFSLIEVMVAVFILAVALVGLTRGITTALGSSKDAENYSQAVQLAASRVELLRAEGDFTEGETTGTAGAYRWRQTISKAPTDGLHQVVVTLEHEPGNVPLYSLHTLLYLATTDTAAEPSARRAETGKSRRKPGRNR
jgi:prepilin-type N-terminal cleavage/methylation domain-containing protein